MEAFKSSKHFGGRTNYFRHDSAATGTPMQFSVFLPEQTHQTNCPAIIYLSGLTCTEENVTTKGGAARTAAELGVIVICPDTSPRGLDLPGEHDSYDFGSGAGFYVNATKAPFDRNYRMYDYVVDELYDLCLATFPISKGRISIMGHSMGGHGALVIGLRNPEKFASISAFSPICAPSKCPWGQKAFSGYLGEQGWQDYDACELILRGPKHKPILIDQGSADEFLEEQLKPELLIEAAEKARYPITYRLQEGYDHSYFFISTYMEEHVRFHYEASLSPDASQ